MSRRHSIVKFPASRRGRPQAAKRQRRALRFEPLEDRRLLAVLHVDGVNGDDVSGDGSAGSPFASIQRGVDTAAGLAGDDTIDIQPGVYSQIVTINDPSGALTLRGSSGTAEDVSVIDVRPTLTNDVRVESMSLEYDIDPPGGTANLAVDNVLAKGRLYVPTSAGDVSVSNSKFGYVYVRNFNDLTLQNVDLIDDGHFRGYINAQYGQQVTIDGADWDDGSSHGIALADVGDVSIKNVSVSQRQGSGVFLQRVGDVSAENVAANDNAGNGIYIFTAGDVSLQTIGASANYNYGIFTRAAGAITAADITANGNAGQSLSNGALFWQVTSVDLDGGEFSNNGQNGLTIAGVSSPVTINGVVANSNVQRGLRVDANGVAVTVAGGTYMSNGLRGIDLNTVNGASISDVQVSDNGSNSLVAGSSDGGGISIGASGLNPIVIDNATVTGNTSLIGGAGIAIGTSGTATVSNSLVQGNSNQYGQSKGGGIYFADTDGTHVVLDSRIEGNASLDGGGIWAWGNLAIERSTIANNSAVTGGGGVWSFSFGSLLVSQSTLSGNYAGSAGGGIRLGVQTTRIVNSTISGNSSGADGGGIYVQYGQPILEWNTIANNTAVGSGGGVYVAAGLPGAALNIIAQNSAPSGPDYFGSVSNTNGFATGGNIVGDVSDSTGFGLYDQTGTSANPFDPVIGPLQDNGGPTETHALLAGSPAIDIPGDAWIDVDQRGVARPVDGDRDGDPFRLIDVGAFEYENTGPSADDDAATTDEDSAVTVSVLANDSDPDGDPLVVTSVSAPTNGSAVINLDGTITYTPNANYNGGDSFVYTIDDGHGGTDSATVDVNVNPVNDDPEVIDAVFSLDENSPNGTDVGMIDASDIDGDDLSFSISGADAAAFAIDSQTGRISVADAALLDFETQSQFDFVVEVSDGEGGQAAANVHVDLANVFEVEIDILPGDPSNQIRLRSKNIEVAILANADLDPLAMLDLSTLRLRAPGSSTSAGVATHRKHGYKYEQRDVNGDGVLDLVLKFKVSDTGLQAGDTALQLEGALLPAYGGESFVVEQAVTVVNGGGKGKKK